MFIFNLVMIKSRKPLHVLMILYVAFSTSDTKSHMRYFKSLLTL